LLLSRFTVHGLRLSEFLCSRVGVLRREFDRLLSARDFDRQTPREFALAADGGVNPPLAGRDDDLGLAVLVQLRRERLALAHQARGEVLEALTGPVLRVELVARRRHVDGVELDGNLLRRDGEAYLRAAQAYA